MLKLLYAVRRRWTPISRYRSPIISTPFCVSRDTKTNVVLPLLENWPGIYRDKINKLIPYILTVKEFSDICRANYIDNRTWALFASSFRRKLVTKPMDLLADGNTDWLHNLCRLIDKANEIHLWQDFSKHNTYNIKNLTSAISDVSDVSSSSDPSSVSNVSVDEELRLKLLQEISQFIFDAMFKKALVDLGPTIEALKTFLVSDSVRFPAQWYPYARMQKRKIIYHGGPTNSGKVSVIKQQTTTISSSWYLIILLIYIYVCIHLFLFSYSIDSPSIGTTSFGRPFERRWFVLWAASPTCCRDLRATE